jgi:hypothetical protein
MDKDELWLEVYSQTDTDLDAAEFLNVNDKTFRAWRRNQGLVNRFDVKRIADRTTEQLENAWLTANTLEEAAEIADLHSGTMSKWIKMQGLPLPMQKLKGKSIQLTKKDVRCWIAYSARTSCKLSFVLYLGARSEST